MSAKILNKYDGIHIAFIGSYPDLSKKLQKMVAGTDIEFDAYYAEFEDTVKIAMDLEHSVDAIITRGMTAELIRDAVDIPVINVPVGPFDLILALKEIKKLPPKVAFINYGRRIYGVDQIENMFGIDVTEYVVMNPSDTKNVVKAISEEGIDFLIGGNASLKIAMGYGIKGVEISTGEETAYRALQEAIHVVKSNKEEKNYNEWLRVTLNSLSEGIVVEDNQGKLVMHNSPAVRMLNIGKKIKNGEDISQILPDNLIQSDNEESGYGNLIQTFGTRKIACNKVRVSYNNDYVATVRTFEDVTKIQILEKKVRAELNKRGFIAKWNFEDICTQSDKLRAVIEKANIYSKSDSPVLIVGESGVGKEMFAQGIHNASIRNDGPFVAINCAALPENLLESELFGYEGGAFSGAKKEGRAGLFELAHNGTIFLDEIGELPMNFQSKLLRAIQEKEILRVGGDRVIPVDIRIISATNKDLMKAVESGSFRRDLYYRLNVLNLNIPPLKERKEDVPLLIKNFLDQRKEPKLFSDDEILSICDLLKNYEWQGNVRELYNFSERIELYKKTLGSDFDDRIALDLIENE